MDNSLPPPPPGNMMGRQRKMRQEQSVELFPPLNGVAVGVAETSTKKKMEKEGGSKSISSRSTDQSGSVYSRSSYFSCRSDRSSSRFSSSTPSFRSSSPCEPTCNPVTLYLRSISGNTPSTGTRRCSTSLPESIVEEEDDIDEEKATGESRANESGLKKKKKKRKKRKRRNTIVTSTGRHFLDCKIPKHIVESLDLKEPLPIISSSLQKELSPLHGVAKHDWINKLTEPELSSLPFPSRPLAKPVIRECPCPQASFLREAFRKYYKNKKATKYPATNFHTCKVTAPNAIKGAPSDYLCTKALLPSCHAPKPSISAGDLKSLLLNHNDHFCRRKPDHTPATLFTHCPAEGLWFVVHPDFRSEPGMRGVDPGKRGVEPW